MPPSQAALARDFLAQRRIAFVGVSRNPRDLSRALFRELRGRGYDLVPVHPELPSVDGVPCAKQVQEIKPPVDGALLMTAPAVTDRVVRDCAAAGTPGSSCTREWDRGRRARGRSPSPASTASPWWREPVRSCSFPGRDGSTARTGWLRACSGVTRSSAWPDHSPG